MIAPELIAPATWRSVEFISDLHLAEDTPRGFAALEIYLAATAADAIFILGDFFEAWVGDDARLSGFEARCAALLARACEQRWIGFMVGNRDFLVGPQLLQACGLQALADPTVLVAFGRRWVLSHGDALCLADTDYLRFRAQVRDAQWQAAFLAQPLATRREQALAMRAASQARARNKPLGELWADVDAGAALDLLRANAASTLIHGHTHRPGRVELGSGLAREVSSDWELDSLGPAPRAEVLRLDATGLARLPPPGLAKPLFSP